MRYLKPLLCLALLCLPSLELVRTVSVVMPAGLQLDADAWRYSPRWAVERARADGVGRLWLDVRGALRVEHPALCPLAIDARARELSARARLRVSGATSQVGYDAPIELRVELPCSEHGQVRWSQLEGEPLAGWQVQGTTLRARTLPRSTYFPAGLAGAPVAVSPRTQGRYVLEVSLEEPGRAPLRQRVVVTSIARATGLTSLATDQAVMLGTPGWRIQGRPRGSEVQLHEADGVATFRADRAGAYRLLREDGAALELRVLTHDRTPMDCGRAECHAAESALAEHSPMSHALERAGGLGDGCMLGCHTTGEPGVDDGGFSQLARELGFTQLSARPVVELPRALHRQAGVRCTACHGPGAIPPAEGRARILRTDVCATCHDAPPRYTHVADWQRSAMAHADAHERVRSEARCAGCHTTGGFLDRIGVRKREDLSRDPDGLHIGLTCSTCHTPHGKSEPHLLRTVSEQGPVCIACHAPQPGERIPAGSQFALLSGVLQLPDGARLEHASAHRDVPCTGCHGAGGRKLDHSFDVPQGVCTSCHDTHPMESAGAAALGAEVETLRRTLAARCSSALQGPLHASEPRCDAAAERALYLLALVSDDGGAAWHNGAFARDLLARARAELSAR